MIASKIIEDSCCGNFTSVDKVKLVKMVKDLEKENEISKHLVAILENQLNNAIDELKKRPSR